MKTSEANSIDCDSVYQKIDSFNHESLEDESVAAKSLSLIEGDFESAEELHRHFLEKASRVRQVQKGESPSESELEIAREVLDGVFSFYGETHRLGDDFDWDTNPGNDHWIHDLNRFHFMPALMKTGRHEGDEVYVRKASSLVSDWVRKNPVTHSWHWLPGKVATQMPNGAWKSYLNIARHLRYWSKDFCELVPHWSPHELALVLKSIHDQCAYLMDIIPPDGNNWTIIGATGLLDVAGNLPELSISKASLAFAVETIERQAGRQVLEDGVHFELAQSYHVSVLNLFSNALDLEDLPGVGFSREFKNTVVSMCDYLKQMILPTGHLVAFNDSDPESTEQAMELLVKEGRRFARSDWEYVGSRGASGKAPEVLSQCFPNGGVVVFRGGWRSEDACLVFDAGPWGAGHQHNDRLSFVLCSHGRSFIVDPGRYLYDTNNPYSGKKYLTTTRAHSTATIDGEEQADAFFPESITPGAPVPSLVWRVNETQEKAIGEHTLGYGERGKLKVNHRRGIIFLNSAYFIIIDRFTGSQEHEIESRLQFHPGALDSDGRIWWTSFSDANLAVFPFCTHPISARVDSGSLDPVQGWYSPRINEIEAAPTLTLKFRSDMPVISGFLLLPYAGTTPPNTTVDLEGDNLHVLVAGERKRFSIEDLLEL